jgi:hypothetical protein
MTAPTFVDREFFDVSRDCISRVQISESTLNLCTKRPTLREGMTVQYIGHNVDKVVSFADAGVVTIGAHNSSDDEFVFVTWKRTKQIQYLSKALVFVNDEAI